MKLKDKAIVVIGANSKIFKESNLKFKLNEYDHFYYSRKDPLLDNKYFFYKWELHKKINIDQLKKYKKIIVLIFAHDWNNYNFKYHTTGFKKLILNFEGISQNIIKKIFFSSFSSHKSSYNFYGKIKYELEKIFIKKDYIIVRIGLIINSSNFFHFKKLLNISKKKMILLPKSSEKFQLIDASELYKHINKLIAKTPRNKIYNLGSKKSYSLKDLILKLSKKKPLFIEINLDLVLLCLRILVFFKIIKYRVYDSVLGLKKQKYYKILLK